jgi:signal transduction histidine kinase
LVAFLLAIVGSVGLLAVHARRQPELRRDLRMLLVAAGVAGVPSVMLAVLGFMQGATSRAATLAMLSFPILPLAYLYAAFRRQLGGLELRVNRLISIYTYLVLLGTIVIPVLLLVHRIPVSSTEQSLITSIIASITVTALSLWAYPRFQSYVEHRVLGIAVPSKELQQTYSSHLTSSSSFAELTRLLEKEVLPSLLVRQFAFLSLDNGSSRVLLRTGLSEAQIPAEQSAALLTPLVGRSPARGLLKTKSYAWIRLVLPLKVQDELVGFWLFGRRDPDDAYSSAEIPILQLFANQAAIALSNILQSERLRAMYQADIDRHENERLSLARDLHDSVLSELAGMLMNTDIRALPKGFQEGYQILTQRLREIVSDLRPPMLNYGLKPAIEELADNLMERSKDTIDIEVTLESDGDRYPVDKEQHLFRIAQEACENAVRHSHGTKITISGRLAPDCVEMSIQDDGEGFKLAGDNLQLYDLLSHRHFGLAGMFERAEVIDAEIRIGSVPGGGTQIFVRWHPRGMAPSPDQGAVDSST